MAFFERKRNLLKDICGESGIRTHGTISDTHAFQACSFSHSDISPDAVGFGTAVAKLLFLSVDRVWGEVKFEN